MITNLPTQTKQEAPILIEGSVRGVVVKGRITFLEVELPCGRMYLLPVAQNVTPFGVTFGGKDYYVHAHSLVGYEEAWGEALSSPPIPDLGWDEF